jgi:hypothetical protein
MNMPTEQAPSSKVRENRFEALNDKDSLMVWWDARYPAA